MSVYKKQIGGSHYKDMKIQPSKFINDNKLLFAEGNAIKYICRHAHKGEVQDLEKAKHYIDMIIERDYGPQESWIDGYNKWKTDKKINPNLKRLAELTCNPDLEVPDLGEIVEKQTNQLKRAQGKPIIKLHLTTTPLSFSSFHLL